MRNKLSLLFLLLIITLASCPGTWAAIQTKLGVGTANDQEFRRPELTGALSSQAKLLIAINIALLHGSISRAQAVNLRQAADLLGEKEDRYLAAGKPIPATASRQDSGDFDGMLAQLERSVQSAKDHELTGTAVLQDQVMSAVARCLTQGKISVNQATEIREKVDLICANESWCLTSGTGTIPENVLQEDTKKLNDLDAQLAQCNRRAQAAERATNNGDLQWFHLLTYWAKPPG